ncbi:MAG: tRNA preQ1(34) S-adenosylmethionine ribosyltransferase-isomerase QueA [Magnetococcales bacterium]|nr:tRNA preQ1(34) S-adenosylmethionine ribosyltransferase-isomerase QueA [Magnetococcales bacterium]
MGHFFQGLNADSTDLGGPDDYLYPLPDSAIAQEPASPRDASRLLVSRPEGVEDRRVADLAELLRPGDLLVFNDTRVLPARLAAQKPSGGQVEVLLLGLADAEGRWPAWIRRGRGVRPGMALRVSESLTLRVLERQEEIFTLQMECEDALAALHHHGATPLPPYIAPSGSEAVDRSRYQTVFATQPGAVAAPTAGLHFTEALLQRLRQAGIGQARVTLHVGPGTFQPVRVSHIADHVMHAEWFQVPAETAAAIRQTRVGGGRVVAVGTTTLRALESAVDASGQVQPVSGQTRLFVLPGFRFQVVDILMTNFHLPASTLLMLVAAFVGRSRLERDYAHAVSGGYRFYSYGDAGLLFP